MKRLRAPLSQLLKALKEVSYETVPIEYFSSSFIYEASGEAVFSLHWGGAGNRSQRILKTASASPA